MADPLFNSDSQQRLILLVASGEDDRRYLHSALESRGYRVESSASPKHVTDRMRHLQPSAVVLDLDEELPAEDRQIYGDLVKQASVLSTPTILLSAEHEFETVAKLLAQGATDYLTRPVMADMLLHRVEVALLAARRHLRRASDHPADEHPPQAVGPRNSGEEGAREGVGAVATGMLVGRSQAMKEVMELVTMVAAKQTTVLITGETGTGKERVAQAIHALSPRRGREMVSVNCGGIPATLLEDEFFGHVKGAFTDAHQSRAGRFEQAHGGNLFLDEIGDLPLELQPKLLRAVQEREIHRIGGVEPLRVDTRIIAATNADLWNRVQVGQFREDLFYRINVFPIHLPPLRERRKDIPLFLDMFVEQFCRRDGLSPKQIHPAAEAMLMSRQWPGNIRELENAVEMAVIRSQERTVIEIGDFPVARESGQPTDSSSETGLRPGAGYKEIVGRFERELIRQVLDRTAGNKTQAADVLQLKRTTLVEKIKKLGQAGQAASGA